MLNKDLIFSRNTLFFSKEEFNKIKNSTIAVCGVGGLGCIVAEILARLGVKKLLLVDNGIIDEPDLSRQSLYSINDLDRRKVDAAKENLAKKAPFCQIETLFADVKKDNLTEFLSDVCGIADCLDNYESRFRLETYLNGSQFLVHGGVENDFGQITTIIKNKTQSLSDIYSKIKNRQKTIAVSTVSVFVIASLMSQEIVNNILEKPQLINKMLVVELSDFSFEKIELR